MIFKDFNTKFLGSKIKLKVVLYMLSGAGPVGERELSRAINTSHVGVGNVLRDLESVNFLRKTKIGNVNVWSLNEKSFAYSATDLQKLAKTQPLPYLKGDLEAHFGQSYAYIKKTVLFGSITEGTEKASSDIDLFILVDKEEHKKAALKIVLEKNDYYKERYGNPISPIIMTEKEAEKNPKLMESIRRGLVI
ncbi:MAG: nucleotidyltransferase domain-containing protein [Candidatus Aenigmarchaeota archaeon]|nr:nucleotidyltransferase domain-containing protein [Candidatus Aenigmarchaeota archaeon]